MKRLVSIKVLALTLLLGAVSVSAVERAFSAHGRGVAAFVPDSSGVLAADITGSGHATHLGLFTNTGRIYFTPDPNNPIIVHPSGEAIFTASDGDKLKVVVQDGQMDVTTGIGTGKFRFDGGTGRFANATGIISYVVEQNLVTGAYEITTVGSIDY